MDRGELVPDAVILGIMRETLRSAAAARGAILDGVVRTVPQAEGLAAAARRARTAARRGDALRDRRRRAGAAAQRADGVRRCQTPYTGREPGTRCAKCGGTLVRRRDDEPDAVRNRLRVYQAQTAPVMSVVPDARRAGRAGERARDARRGGGAGDAGLGWGRRSGVTGMMRRPSARPRLGACGSG